MLGDPLERGTEAIDYGRWMIEHTFVFYTVFLSVFLFISRRFFLKSYIYTISYHQQYN